MRKTFIQINAENQVFHEFTYEGPPKVAGADLTDVTDRGDWPFIGKIYDAQTDTFSDPPEEDPEEDPED